MARGGHGLGCKSLTVALIRSSSDMRSGSRMRDGDAAQLSYGGPDAPAMEILNGFGSVYITPVEECTRKG